MRFFFQALKPGAGKFCHRWKTGLGLVLFLGSCAGATLPTAPPATNAPPLTLTIQAAVQLALLQNRELIKLAAAQASELLGVADARTEFATQIQPAGNVGSAAGVANYQYGLRALKKFEWGSELELGGQVLNTDLPGSAVGTRDSVRVSLAQPLFRYAGGLMHREGLERAASRVLTARRNVEMKKNDLLLQVTQTYEDLVRLRRLSEMEFQAGQRLEKLLRLTQAREKQGRATRVDVLRVELQRGQTQSRIEDLRQRRASLEMDLADLLGMDAGASFDLAASPALDVAVQPPEETIRTALANRLDLAQILQDYRDVARGLRVARHKLLPDLKLVTTLERFGEGANVSDAAGLNQNNWFVGLQLDSNLDPLRERIAYRQAELSENTAREDIETAERLVRRQVRQQLLAYDRACSEVQRSENNRAVAQNRQRLAHRLFELGRGDNFTVTDAEQELQRVETDWLAARSEAALAGCRLWRATGTLLACPPELKPVPLSAAEAGKQTGR
ncbi:MAG: TolC family protein [Kiritimatiellaeota bacterium]|nr:TolC family protein [Kiritimatiellota bacterium]